MRGREFVELQAFLAIAEHGSFSLAASKLGMSRSVLSQIIRELEERLGVRLLNRTTRSVAPSQAGERLLARLRPALADLAGALDDVATLAGRVTGVLRLNSSHWAASHVLAPLVGPFLAEYPDLRLEIVADDRLVDIVAGRFDAGVRLGEKVERDMIAVKLGGPLRMVAVASPDHVARHGRPLHPRDLTAHRCITTWWPTDLTPYHWEFEKDGVALEVAVDGPLAVNEPAVAVQAASAGTGIAYLFEHQVARELESGALVALLEDWSPSFPGFYLYHPSRRHTPPALRALIDFLAARVR